MDLAAQAVGIGALADPLRRALYAYVTAQPDAVGREAAAGAVDIPLHTAKFHLDRLVADGLLDVEYRRTSGRSGPGAGRPAKLYRRADRQFTVSLPERRYDLVGHILATAFRRAADGTALDEALHGTAHEEGHRLGASVECGGETGAEAEAENEAGNEAGAGDGSGAKDEAGDADKAGDAGDLGDLGRLAQTLATQGYEPRSADGTLILANCPFDSLAKEHTDLVCGLNRSYVQGVADGLGCPHVHARLDPAPDRCCVTAADRRTD